VHKLAGAAAQAGASLAEVAAAATEGVEAMGTMGVALTPCIVPGNAPSDRLAGDKVRYLWYMCCCLYVCFFTYVCSTSTCTYLNPTELKLRSKYKLN
jgi:hypothetical protein